MASAARPFSLLLSPSLTLAASGLLALLAGCSGDPGAACAVACPGGSQCVASAQQGGAPSTDGNVCVADDASPLLLDAKVHRLSGVVQSDTLSCPLTQEVAQELDLTLVDRDQRLTVNGRIACRDDGSLGFTATVPPGRYDVLARVARTTLKPLKALEVRGARQDLRLDLRMNTVTGPVLLNGLPASVGCASAIDLDFYNEQGLVSSFSDLCPTGPTVNYDARLPPGTYRVSGKIKDQPVAADGFTVGGASTAQALNLAGFRIGATLSLNGARLRDLPGCAKAMNASQTYPLQLTFTSQGADGKSFLKRVSCKELDGGFNVPLPSGAYRVAADLDRAFFPALLPSRVAIAAPLSVRGDQDGVALDLRTYTVSGSVALGRARASLCGATAFGQGTLSVRLFDGAARDIDPPVAQQLALPCGESDTLDFQTSLAPGTYTLGLGPEDRPRWDPLTDPVLLREALTVKADRAGVLVQPTLARLSGRLLVENTLPTAPRCRDDGQVIVDLALRERQSGALTVVPIRCQDRDSFAFQADVAPGTYDISVGAGEAPPPEYPWPARNRYAPTLEGMSPVLAHLQGGAPSEDGLVVSGDLADLRLSLRARSTYGSLTVNGATPAVPAACARAVRDGFAVVKLVFQGQPGVRFVTAISCQDTDYSFRLPLAVGTYQVALRPYGDELPGNTPGLIAPAELPSLSYGIEDALMPLVPQLRLR